MSKLRLSAMCCGVTIGIFAPLTTVQATEVNDLIQSHLGEGVSAQAGQNDDWASSEGPQGPIRSDLIDSKSSDSDYAANVKAMETLVSEENP
jgi:hypothetical protein